MKAKILKRLTINGETLDPNTIVDVSAWRNAKTLEGSRYITFVLDTSEIVDETPKKETKTKIPKEVK